MSVAVLVPVAVPVPVSMTAPKKSSFFCAHDDDNGQALPVHVVSEVPLAALQFLPSAEQPAEQAAQ
eukprot:m.25327 g.25327  ORF g.25327 m.25327 type:complete len:66 (-) comp9833_c0_seq1:768-965(-)